MRPSRSAHLRGRRGVAGGESQRRPGQSRLELNEERKDDDGAAGSALASGWGQIFGVDRGRGERLLLTIGEAGRRDTKHADADKSGEAPRLTRMASLPPACNAAHAGRTGQPAARIRPRCRPPERSEDSRSGLRSRGATEQLRCCRHAGPRLTACGGECACRTLAGGAVDGSTSAASGASEVPAVAPASARAPFAISGRDGARSRAIATRETRRICGPPVIAVRRVVIIHHPAPISICFSAGCRPSPRRAPSCGGGAAIRSRQTQYIAPPTRGPRSSEFPSRQHPREETVDRDEAADANRPIRARSCVWRDRRTDPMHPIPSRRRSLP